ncbi:MAG: hypothetical protein AAGA92_14625 [Planctomycetota bacterium]
MICSRTALALCLSFVFGVAATPLRVYAQPADLAEIAAESLLAHPQLQIPGRREDPGAVSVGSDFTQGVPGDDYEFSAIYVTPLITGERGGYDVLSAVNPQDEMPGAGTVIAAYGSVNRASEDIVGDLYLLGDERKPYYLSGQETTGVDNDFMRVIGVEPGTTVRLHGSPADYTVVPVSTEFETGSAVFYTAGGSADMVGFVKDTTLSNSAAPLFEYVTPADLPSASPAIASGFSQIGGLGANLIMDVEVDANGDAYVIGMTREDLRPIHADARGAGALFAAKYRPDGSRVWLRQFGSEAGTLDLALDADVDGEGLYLTGRYLGEGPIGQKDEFITKIDTESGQIAAEALWGGPGTQFGGGLTLDNSEYVYTVGIGRDINDPNQTGDQDPFVEKRRRDDLSLVWRRTYGAGTNKEPWGQVAFSPNAGGVPGEGSIYSSGWVIGDFEAEQQEPGSSRDVWLSSFDQDGNLQWVEQWGSSDGDTEWAWSTVVDQDGYVYVGGHTYGDMGGDGSQLGDGDGFVTKIDPDAPDGERVVWTRHVGTDGGDDVRRLVVHDGLLYLSGYTWGSFEGFENAGLTDVYAATMTLDGILTNVVQLGTERDERAFLDVGADGVFLGGFTEGSLTSANGGFSDAYLLSLGLDLSVPVPEPCGVGLAVVFIACWAPRRGLRRHSRE